MTLFSSGHIPKKSEEALGINNVKLPGPTAVSKREYIKSPTLCGHVKSITKVVINDTIELSDTKGKVGDIHLKCSENCGWIGISERMYLDNIIFESHIKIIDVRGLNKEEKKDIPPNPKPLNIDPSKIKVKPV